MFRKCVIVIKDDYLNQQLQSFLTIFNTVSLTYKRDVKI